MVHGLNEGHIAPCFSWRLLKKMIYVTEGKRLYWNYNIVASVVISNEYCSQMKCTILNLLTHLSPPGQNGSHFTLNTFKCIFMITFAFRFGFPWSLFLRAQLTSIGSGNGLAPNRWQAITWTNAYSVHWRIYVALGGDELTLPFPVTILGEKTVRAIYLIWMIKFCMTIISQYKL